MAAGDLVDPTVCDPAQKAQIEQHYGVSLDNAPSELLRLVVDRSKQAGNQAFKSNKHAEAVKMYSQAIAGAPADHTLFANRSAAYLALGRHEEARLDASKAVQLAPAWPKGHYRLGSVFMAVSQWTDAVAAFEAGLKVDPTNKEMVTKLADAREQLQEEVAVRKAQANMHQRDLVLKLREARREEVRMSMLNQFKQSMAAPDWELDDYDWRPTFLPNMKLKPLPPANLKADPKRRMLADYINALADLARPKAALRMLGDDVRLGAFEDAMLCTLREQPGGHILALGSGTGVLSLLAARCGAGRVTAIERSRMLFRMAKQALEANADVEGADIVHLLDRRLHSCGVTGEALPPDVQQAIADLKAQAAQITAAATLHQQHEEASRRSMHGTRASGSPTSTQEDAKTNMNGHGLGCEAAAVETMSSAAVADDSKGRRCNEEVSGSSSGGIKLAAEQTAGSRTDAGAQAECPTSGVSAGQEQSSLEVEASGNGIMQEHGPEPQQGQQVQRPDTQRMLQAIDAEIGRLSLEAQDALPERADILVTDLVDHAVLGMGLLGTLDYAAEHLLKAGARVVPSLIRVYAMLVEVRITPVSGFDLSTLNRYRWHPHHERVNLDKLPFQRLSKPFKVADLDLQSRVDSLSGGRHLDLPQTRWEADSMLEVPATADGTWNGVAFWFEMTTYEGVRLTSWGGSACHPSRPSTLSALSTPASATSWQQALQYIDGVKVRRGEHASVRVRQDAGQFHFASQPQQSRPRHAYIPRWHFDMVLDNQRNDAYERAITKAIEFRRASGIGAVRVLDVGAGSGLLSMMAARSGATHVVGAEMSQHMCDVAAETVVMNGFAAHCLMVNKDVRRMDVVRKPDGTPPDMEHKADIMVFEVFDSGLIGEGVLHSVAAAQAKLLTPDAILVPCAATVYCQLIQMRINNVKGLDMGQANRWRWQPDYEGVELRDCRNAWKPLSRPTPVMAFDFYESALNMQAQEVTMAVPVSEDGVANAVAFWFDLQLDEDTQLSTSPYVEKGATWQQAVQWIPELHLRKGDRVQLTAKHDTYGISFQTAATGMAVTGGQPAVPLKDAVWEAAYNQLSALNGQLAKSCVQNPLEYRTVALAAVDFGARPHDLSLDTEQAVEFCTKMMG